jgi:DtxR family transcriptional regulator, manganese transport regulator
MKSEERHICRKPEHFKEIRAHRLLTIAEDYTELIADLIANKGHVRVCDIARDMGVSHVSVLKTIKRLVRDGYITYNATQSFELTQKGQETAAFSKKKHLILTEFFLHLGIPECIVAKDVEGIEHYVSAATLDAIITFLKKNRHNVITHS